MIRFTILILTLFTLLAGSCSERKTKLDSTGLIPEKELIPLLTDLYISDGLLALPKVRGWLPPLDSLSTYYHVIEKHGYSRETMDKTMQYYFIKKPKKLIEIYDQIIGILSERESILEREVLLAESHIKNLWTGKEFYSIPDLAGTDSTKFDITLYRPGIYTLTFSALLFPDDQSVDPGFTAYSCHPDSIENGKRKYIQTINYIKDGQPHTYSIILTVPDNKVLHFRGWLYDFRNNPFEFYRHIIIENISLTYSPLVIA